MNTGKHKLKPYSNNIVFVDTEFSDLDPYKGEILSIGLVKMDGTELYLELEYDGTCSQWVEDNILPSLTKEKTSREKAKNFIKEFLGTQMPYLMGFVNQYDDVYLSKLFNNQEKPYNYMPLDLATLLYFQGIDPDSDFSTQFGVDSAKYREHHALDDARWVRDVYLKMLE